MDEFDVSVYSPLSGSSYAESPDKLKNSKRRFDWFRKWWQVFSLMSYRALNPLETHSERITKVDTQMVNSLDYGHIRFPISKKDYSKIVKKNSIYIISLVKTMVWFIQFMYQM